MYRDDAGSVASADALRSHASFRHRSDVVSFR
jgi:hypothetical protein